MRAGGWGTHILRNQPSNHDKGSIGLGQHGRGAQDVAVREAHGEAQVLGAARIERRHDAVGDFAVALVEEGAAALQDLWCGRFVHVVPAVGWGWAVGRIGELGGNCFFEFLEGVDGLGGG